MHLKRMGHFYCQNIRISIVILDFSVFYTVLVKIKNQPSPQR